MFAKRSREPGTRGARVAAQEIDGEKGGRGGQLAKTWVAWTGRVKKTLVRKQGWGTRKEGATH